MMKKLSLLVLVFSLAMVGGVSASEASWWGEWDYRVPITLNGLEGSENILEIPCFVYTSAGRILLRGSRTQQSRSG